MLQNINFVNMDHDTRLRNLDYVNACLLSDCGRRSEAEPSTLEDKQTLMRMLMNIRQPIAARADFVRAQDVELQLQLQDKGVVDLGFGNGPLSEWQGDITRLAVDAIVNAANAQGLGCWRPLHNCIDNCIHSAAGIQLRLECQRQLQGRLIDTAEPIITSGYNLPARHVIHVVGPIVDGAEPSALQRGQLADCYTRTLDLAAAHGLHSVAFPCISTGVFCFPNALAATIAVDAVRQWQDSHADSCIAVIFNTFKDDDHELYTQLLG